MADNPFLMRMPDPSAPPMDSGLPTDTTPYMQDGALLQPNPDGSMDISLSPPTPEEQRKDIPFDANLAEHMDERDLNVIGLELITAINSDIESSSEWRDNFAKSVKLLGLKIEEPGTDPSATGISKVYHPLLLEAVVRDQANAMGELLPAGGPVKVDNTAPKSSQGDADMASNFETRFNYYLTVTDKEYYPDFDQMLFVRALSGCTFRKVYMDPIKKRPISRFLTGMDFIVSNDALSLSDCGRKTHKIMMRHSTLKRMQVAGQYRDVPLVTPTEAPDNAETVIKSIEGISVSPQLPADHRHTIYESYVEWDLPGFEHKDHLPLPYRITIDKDSSKILEIRRNWKEGDKTYTERRRFVKYGYIPGLGFYDYGLAHLLGNTTRSLTAMLRQLLDAGQFDNFPAFLIAANSSKQETNEIRLGVGQGKEIDTNGQPIQNVVMPLPYKGPSAVLAGLAQTVAQDGQRLGGTPDTAVGEGNQEAPVGTTMALIEQATKVMAATHKRAHMAQQEEFEIFKELFQENPSALMEATETPQAQAMLMQALNDVDIVPASDPNTPSHMHRIMRANAIAMLCNQTPGANVQQAAKFSLQQMGVSDEDIQLLIPPPPPTPPAPPPPTPDAQLKAQVENQKMQLRMKETALNAAMRTHEVDTKAKLQLATLEAKQRGEMVKLAQKHTMEAQNMAMQGDRLAHDKLHGIAALLVEHTKNNNGGKE